MPSGPYGFGRLVQRLAVREDVGFGQLVEAVDQQLHDEDEQEDRGDLEEARRVDAIAVARPQPGDERRRRACRRSRRRRSLRRLDGEEQRVISSAVSIPSRVIISSVKPNTPRNAARPILSDDASRRPSISRLHPLARAPHVHRQRRDEHGGDERRGRLPRATDCWPARAGQPGADAERDRDGDAPVHGGQQRAPAGLLQVGQADRDDQKGLEPFPQRDDERLNMCPW